MMHQVLALCLLVVGTGSVLFAFVMQACVRAVLRRATPHGPTPPVSILKPLKGADPELYENLASLARQDYPNFELVFGAEDAMDPGLAVARRIARDFPEVRVRIVAGGRPIGHNPKVNNLAHMARAAVHDWILVSDADVRTDPPYLRHLASETRDPRVGLVSSVIANTDERSLGASFDTLHMNGFVAAVVCAADVLAGHPCVVGKSMLLRKSDIARFGGFYVVKDVLAEDYVLGQLYKKAGHRVALSGHPIRAVAPDRTVKSFFERHLRWSQMRRHIAPAHHVGEPLLHPTPWLVGALACALSAGRAVGRAEALIACAVVALLFVKVLGDALQIRKLRGSFPALEDLALVPVKDLLMIVGWALSLVKTTVEWRGNAMRIGPGSTLTPAYAGSEGRRAQRSQA